VRRVAALRTALVLLLTLLAGCNAAPRPTVVGACSCAFELAPEQCTAACAPWFVSASASPTTLRPGDVVRITSGDSTAEFVLDGEGYVNMPLGGYRWADLTAAQLETELEGIFGAPVNVEVVRFY
jgi:protein involved in polysaccharide export with SLBB domain